MAALLNADPYAVNVDFGVFSRNEVKIGSVPECLGLPHDLDLAVMRHDCFKREARAQLDQALANEIRDDRGKIGVNRDVTVVDSRPSSPSFEASSTSPSLISKWLVV